MKQKYFKIAKLAALKSTHTQHKHGCVIVKKNRIISIGFNKSKTHPKSPHLFHHIHAEIDAILGLDLNDLKGATLYVGRWRKNGATGLSKPCESCFSLIMEVGIDSICYSDYNDQYIEEKL